MKVSELILALQSVPGDLEVLSMHPDSYDLRDAEMDIAKRLPPRTPYKMHDWEWERDNPPEKFSQRVVVIY